MTTPNRKPYSHLSKRPLKVTGSRVWRTYSGGSLLESWQGKTGSADGDFPEEWVASTVEARNVGREHRVEGLSTVQLPEGTELTLRALIESDPPGFLGSLHFDKYGTNPAVLVKLIDSSERLSIQVHPNRRFAKDVFRSPFGKTEAWHILGGRTIGGQEPYFLLGFKPGVGKEGWKQLFAAQDIETMTSSLHMISPKAGETFLIEGGVPHAIGSGCLLIEIQEPTDYTLRVERTTVRGETLEDAALHQGAGFDKLLDCFHYQSFSYEETVRRWRIQPDIVRQVDGGKDLSLIGKRSTDRFRMHRLDITTRFNTPRFASFVIAIVVSGKGSIDWGSGKMEIQKGDQLFVPAASPPLRWEILAEETLKVVLCFPPG